MECDKSCGNAGVHGSQSLGVECMSMPVCVRLRLICVHARMGGGAVLSALACARGCVERLSVGQAGMAETLHSSFSPNRATWVVGELNRAALALRSPADSHQI